MKKMIFLLTILVTALLSCDNEEKKQDNNSGELGPIASFFIRLVDTEGNWIEDVEEKEMKLLVADSNWNITPGVFYDHSMWWIEKHYNYVGNEKEEFIGEKKELLSIEITTYLKDLSYSKNNDDTYEEYLVLQIDENTSLNIQLFYKEFYTTQDLV